MKENIGASRHENSQKAAISDNLKKKSPPKQDRSDICSAVVSGMLIGSLISERKSL